jgi:sulfate transport system ATP-binding protein
MQIRVDNISKAFGTLPALSRVDVTIPSGKLVALLGPSGSGKTTLLRVIAGIEAPDRGRVFFGETDVTDRPVRDRKIGFVFQDYALFDHMTVAQNIAFGLKVRKQSPLAIEVRVRELLQLIQLPGVASRLPRQLSGGQRQRVALARALAPEPQLLLLDEPFGALDARVRQELRGWLRRLHDTLHVTSVFVTHDQDEALEVADQIVVMNDGKVEQIGEPELVFDQPASSFVMDFLGGVNVVRGEVKEGVGAFGPLVLPCDDVVGPAAAYVRTRDLELVRSTGEAEPEPFRASPRDARGEPVTALAARITRVRRIGVGVRVELEAGPDGPATPLELTAELPDRDFAALGAVVGDRVTARILRARVFAKGGIA